MGRGETGMANMSHADKDLGDDIQSAGSDPSGVDGVEASRHGPRHATTNPVVIAAPSVPCCRDMHGATCIRREGSSPSPYDQC
jgi:hypothetical protein